MTALPDSFLFGVAISDHQAEAFDPRFPPDVWDVWEQRPGLVPRGRATDFWNRWEEDVLNAQRLGCRAFRFSIAWARVEPRPGEFDPGVLDHYRAIVNRLRALDMEPIVTLCHFVWPKHVEDRGGLRSERFADWFAAYAARVRAALDPQVRYWITFNEPNILLQGFYKFWFQPDFMFPPGQRLGAPLRDQIETTIAVIRHLFEAHAAARQALRAGVDGERNLVSANVFRLGLPLFVQHLIDRNIRRLKKAEDWREQFWRVAERPTLFERRVDVIVAPAAELRTRGFEAAYFVTGLGALVLYNSACQGLDDLRGRPIAFVRGPEWEHVAAVRLQLGNSRFNFFDTHRQALAALDAGQVAAIIADQHALYGLAHLHPDEYRVLDERFTHQVYTVAFEAGHPTLTDAVQRAVRALQSEPGWIELCRHYFPMCAERHDPAPFEPLPATSLSSALGQIQARGKVIVGMPRSDLPLFDRLNPAAAHGIGPTPDRVGIEFDLGRALAGVIFGDPACVGFLRASLPRRSSLGLRVRDRLDNWLRAYTIFSTFVSSSWWYMGLDGQLPEYLCPHPCVGQLDFVSFDYYFGVNLPTPRQIRRLAHSWQGRFNRAPLWAGGLLHALRYYHEMFPNLPILIAENGFADEPDSRRRGEQIAAHLHAVQKAVAEGIDVRAYCVWSITSNREWGLPQDAASDFGLYYINMDGDPELNRYVTPSAEVYRDLIAQRGAV
ncbi:MAG TPA: family 1 glycosylhydrolase [Anaerolineae bacterium]|nr:family 1 glycosylhydrolase [Anaerolineae bacterium]